MLVARVLRVVVSRDEVSPRRRMFRAAPPGRRVGGGQGAPTTIARSDGGAMRGKGRQYVPHGQRVMLAFPGGGGYGIASARNSAHVLRDLVRGYISAQSARDDDGLSDEEISNAYELARLGQDV